jgi:hypothetical protein
MKYTAIFKKITLTVLSALLFFFFSTENASAQMDEVVIVKQKAKTTIRPKAKPAPAKVDFVRKVSIVRVEKKSRKNYKKPVINRNVKTAPKIVPKKLEVPLLAIQLKLLIVNKDGSESEFNPMATFTPDDRLRLSVKANQRGYLYIVRQKAPDEDGEIIFPTALANNGKNLISANYEYVVPSNCPKDIIPNPRDCALTLFPYSESPKEYFTLIYTRDQLVDFPDDVINKRISLKNFMSAGKLPLKLLVDLIEDSNQDLVSQTGDLPYGIRIVNKNLNDNEEIIETFVLNKLKK